METEHEDYLERFGEIAHRKEYITWPQMLEALEIQLQETFDKGEVRFIGDIPNDNYTYPSATITLTHLDDV